MAFFAVDDVGAEQWHRRLNHAFSEATALRQSNYREDVLVRFGRFNQKVGATSVVPALTVPCSTDPSRNQSNSTVHPARSIVFLSMDAYRVTWVSSQKSTPAAM